MKPVPIAELANLLGVTVRRLEEDVKDGLPVSKIGPRKVRLFDVEVAKQWRRTNRRQVFGEGRSRSKADIQARARRLLSEPASSQKQRTPPVEMADLDHTKILQMVMEGKLDQAHSKAYIAGVEAMERGLEFRLKTASLVEAKAVQDAAREALVAARLVLESGNESLVAAVAALFPLTDVQRNSVRAVVEANTKNVMRALAKIGGKA